MARGYAVRIRIKRFWFWSLVLGIIIHKRVGDWMLNHAIKVKSV